MYFCGQLYYLAGTGFHHVFGLFINMGLFLHHVCGHLVSVGLVLHHVYGPFISMGYFLRHVCRSLVSMGLTLHHVFGPLVSVELEVLYYVCGLLVSMRCGFSVVDLSACTSLRFRLFSFSTFDLSTIGTSTYQFFCRSRLFSFSVGSFLAFVASTRQTFWLFFFIIVFRREALECWFIFIVVRKLGQSFSLVIFKDPKVFYLNDFILILDVNPVNCVIIVTY